MSTRYVWGKYSAEAQTYLNRSAIPTDSQSSSNLISNFNNVCVTSTIEPLDTNTNSPLYTDNPYFRMINYTEITFSDGETRTISAGSYFGHSYLHDDNISFPFLGMVYAKTNCVLTCVVKDTHRMLYLTSGTAYIVRTRWGQGSLEETLSSTSNSTYPTNGIKGEHWYTYQGSDSIDPSAVSYSTISPKGGESITINVSPRSNTYGGMITYKYQVQLDGGSWIDIGSTTSTAKSYIIPKGTSTFRARVVASDNMGFTSTDYVTGSTCSVINNTAPSISGEDSDLGTFRYEYPTVSYTITDPDEQVVTRKIELDSTVVVPEESIVLGQEYSYTVTEEQMSALEDGVHTITITAADNEGASSARQYTFTKFFGVDYLYQRLRRLNTSGIYDIIYFENDADTVLRPDGTSVQQAIDTIEAELN